MQSDGNHPVLRFEHVSVRLEDVQALEDISFEVFAGESRIIFGAAGSGKTVLVKTALGLIKPDSGRVCVFGQDITNMRERQLFEVRSRIGVLFQEGGLFDSLTIEENVNYGLLNQPALKCSPGEARQRVEDALRFVELEHTLEKFPSELSGGMRRRVGIARAAVTEPQLVLYDSPTAGLDPITAYTIIALIIKERDLKNTTTLMVTHRFQDGHFVATSRFDARTQRVDRVTSEELTQGTRFLVLKEGRLVFEGTLAEFEQSQDPYVAKFVKRED
jgi:phospholipid/cholesterol/gamma-HCH transport system ATP-binding protein